MKPVFVGLASASILVLCLCGASASKPTPMTQTSGEVHHVVAAVPGAVTLYDQNDSDSGGQVVSENFVDGGFEDYDSYGADDFAVPAGHKWKIHEVDVTGVYGQQSEPADSENILFYKGKQGLPGKLVAECDSLKGIDTRGSFAVKLPKSCRVKLRGGYIYWVSVVANENNFCCTAWYWETRSSQNGNPAAWENPNGGFGICPTWEPLASCFGDGVAPDLMFALKGKDVVPN